MFWIYYYLDKEHLWLYQRLCVGAEPIINHHSSLPWLSESPVVLISSAGTCFPFSSGGISFLTIFLPVEQSY